MIFNDDAYLGEQMEYFRQDIKQKYNEYFNLGYKINRYSNNKINTIIDRKLNCRDIYCICLYLKILNGFQSCIILLEHGLRNEAEALSRTLCDPLYIIKIMSDDPQFCYEYHTLHLHNQRTKINAGSRDKHAIFDPLREENANQKLAELNERLKAFDCNIFAVEQLSIKAKMHCHYDTMFRFTSDLVHADPETVLGYGRDKNGEVIFNWGPIEDKIDEIIISIAYILITANKIMNGIYCYISDIELDEIMIEYKALYRGKGPENP